MHRLSLFRCREQATGATLALYPFELQDPEAPTGLEPATSHSKSEVTPIYATATRKTIPAGTDDPGLFNYL